MKNLGLKKSLIITVAIFSLIITSFFTVVEARDFFIEDNNDLTDSEKEGILFMREEEKLARDVYLTFHDIYDTIPIFKNIAESEQNHMDAVKTLINRYGLGDPTEGKDIGEFANQELQQLYYKLISFGSGSLIITLEVGAEIEEIDIIDLKKYKSQTDKDNILRVYSNLLKGSDNHLRAFVKNLKIRGETYIPKHLSQEEFDDIINKNSRFTISPKKLGNNDLINNQFRNKIQIILMLFLKNMKNKYNGGEIR